MFLRSIASILISVAVSLSMVSPLHAAEDTKARYEKLQERIKAEREKLKRTNDKEFSIVGELQKLEKDLYGVEKRLEGLNSKMRKTKREARRVRSEIDGINKKIESHRKWMKEKLVAMYKNGLYRNSMQVFASSGDLSDLTRRWKYLEILTLSERRRVDEFSDAIVGLRTKEQKLDAIYKELEADAREISEAEDALRESKDERKVLLAAVKSEKESYLKMIRELEENSKQLLKLLEESQKDKDYDYSGKGFRAIKGKLTWPVNGVVVFNYGMQEDPQFKTKIFRNGIYIKTEEGSNVTAVHEGKVVYADWFKGYGQLVIINHGEGYNTLYANLKEIFLNVGDIIKGKAKIGTAGESSLVGAPSLYFEVRYKGKPLDPIQWLRRR